MAIKNPLVVYNGQISELLSSDSLNVVSGGSGGSVPIAESFVTIDFINGNNLITSTVNNTSLLATDKILLNIVGTSTTVDHNQYEHMLASKYIELSLISFTAGVGLTFSAYSEIRLSGKFEVQILILSTIASTPSSPMSSIQDLFTATLGQTIFTLSNSISGVSIVTINGFQQKPITDYLIIGTELTFSYPLSLNDEIIVTYGVSLGVIDLTTKQDVLVSGVNINTINGLSLLGNRDITISASSSVVSTVEMQDTQIVEFIPFFSVSPSFFESGVNFIVSNLNGKIGNTYFSTNYDGVNDTNYGRTMGAILGYLVPSTTSSQINSTRAIANGNGGYHFNFHGGLDEVSYGATKVFIGIVVQNNSYIYQNLNIDRPFFDQPAYVGIGCERTDSNLQIMHKSQSGLVQKIDLGIDFPVENYTHYRIDIKCFPDVSSTNIIVQIINLFNGGFYEVTLSTEIPLSNENISPIVTIVSDNDSTYQTLSIVKLRVVCKSSSIY